MKIIVAITGASGIIYGFRLAEVLKRKNELILLVSDNARIVAKSEGVRIDQLRKFGKVFLERDVDAPCASGSFRADGMVVCPCSMKTLSAIANGYSGNIITRSADVIIKEHKKLILVVREMPLSQIHLRNMIKLSKMGVVIMPACPAFYHRPKKIEDMVDFVVGKVLDSLGIENELFRRWGDGV